MTSTSANVGEELQQLGRAVDPAQEQHLDRAARTATPERGKGRASQKPIRDESHTATYMPSMYSEPCAKLTMRVTPKMSDSRRRGETASSRRRARSGIAGGRRRRSLGSAAPDSARQSVPAAQSFLSARFPGRGLVFAPSA